LPKDFQTDSLAGVPEENLVNLLRTDPGARNKVCFGATMPDDLSATNKKYHVALSFAGEDREFVERVAIQLAAE